MYEIQSGSDVYVFDDFGRWSVLLDVDAVPKDALITFVETLLKEKDR